MRLVTALQPVTARPPGSFVPGWGLHPSVLIGIAALAVLYLGAWGPLRRRLAPEARVHRWRVACFLGAVLVLLGGLNGPIHLLSDNYLFSVHMVQHLVLTMAFPPLLIAAVPGWMLAPLLRPGWIRSAARLLGRPLVAGFLFSVTLAAWHVAGLYDLMMKNHDVHVVTHLLFMVTAVIMWWPVMSPVPEFPRLTPGLGMLYLFLVGVPMQLLAAIITFSDSVLYPWYAAAPRTWGLSVLDDQRLGGLIMWIPGNLWIWGAMSVLFFQWARKEGDVR